jgi:hypothetical protein
MDDGPKLSEVRDADIARRRFLARLGKFAAVTPPTITMMLSVAAKPEQARASTFPGIGRGVGGDPQKKRPGQHP